MMTIRRKTSSEVELMETACAGNCLNTVFCRKTSSEVELMETLEELAELKALAGTSQDFF